MTTNSIPGQASSHSGGEGSGSMAGGDGDPRPRLLVVDDQEDNRELLAHRLGRHGFQVDTASDGYTALDLVESAHYDLILLDVRMPGMDGHEVLQRIRGRHSINELPVVMVSALTESQTVIQALELGANDYVTEPIDFDVALARIHNLLRTSAAAARASAQPPEPAAGRVEVGSVVEGRYRLEAVVGAGGFAKVYRATQLSTGQPVAVKILHTGRWHDPEEAEALRRRFELEMQLIGRLTHPNVVRLLDSGTVFASGRASAPPPGASGIATREEGTARDSSVGPLGGGQADECLPYLVMELLQGETLQSKLKREGSLSFEETVDLMLPVMSGVGAAHARGAIHRDLKPANIFLADEGGQLQPKVLDFGIAKLVDRTSGAGLTQTAALIGTPEYMAPEQTCGKDVDVRCDQFTIASVLYECLTGRRAFEGKSVIDVVRRVYQGEFPELPEDLQVPQSFREALRKASAAEPEERFPSIEHLGLALLESAGPGTRSRWEAPLRRAAERAGEATLKVLVPGEVGTADTVQGGPLAGGFGRA